jgi:hypothetical protein
MKCQLCINEKHKSISWRIGQLNESNENMKAAGWRESCG